MDKDDLDKLDKIENETKSAIDLLYNLTIDYDKRYNLLITAICSGALVLIFQILKEVLEKDISLFLKITLFIALVIFSIALILNLLLPKIIQSELEDISKIAHTVKKEIRKRQENIINEEDSKSKELSIDDNVGSLSKLTETTILLLVLAGIVDLGVFFFVILFCSK